MDFEWDPAKATSNLRKHGVDFEDAVRIFYDPWRIEKHDGRENYGEDRWVTIGMTDMQVLFVAYTVRHEDTIRLISARRANASEKREYRENDA